MKGLFVCACLSVLAFILIRDLQSVSFEIDHVDERFAQLEQPFKSIKLYEGKDKETASVIIVDKAGRKAFVQLKNPMKIFQPREMFICINKRPVSKVAETRKLIEALFIRYAQKDEGLLKGLKYVRTPSRHYVNSLYDKIVQFCN